MMQGKLRVLLFLAFGAAVATLGCGDAVQQVTAPGPGPGPGPDPDPVPTLPPADPTTVLIVDDVDGENGGNAAPNYTGFQFWNVVEGCVDLHGPGGVNPRPGNGLYIDMDGTCNDAGTIETKEAYQLHPADYRLEMIMAGNSQVSQSDTMTIKVGSGFEWELILPDTTDFDQFDFNFTVADTTEAKIRLEHNGGDEQGILIDVLRLRSIE